MCVCEVRERERDWVCVYDFTVRFILVRWGCRNELNGDNDWPAWIACVSSILVEIVDSRDNIMQIKAPKCFPSQYHQSYPVIWQSHLHYKLSSWFGRAIYHKVGVKESHQVYFGYECWPSIRLIWVDNRRLQQGHCTLAHKYNSTSCVQYILKVHQICYQLFYNNLFLG